MSNTINTLEGLRDYINSTQDWELVANRIIEENGWENEINNEYGICNDGTRRLYFNKKKNNLIANIKDLNELDIEDIAYYENLEIIETTSERNGYPCNIRKALIGFENFDEAESLSKKYGLNIELFTKRDGWQLWYRTNNKAYSPIEISAEDYGDNYHQYSSNDINTFYRDVVKDRLDEFDNFEDLQSFIDDNRRIYEEIGSIDDNELVITCCGKYYETVNQYSMYHSFDSKKIAIGLI